MIYNFKYFWKYEIEKFFQKRYKRPTEEGAHCIGGFNFKMLLFCCEYTNPDTIWIISFAHVRFIPHCQSIHLLCGGLLQSISSQHYGQSFTAVFVENVNHLRRWVTENSQTNEESLSIVVRHGLRRNSRLAKM